MAQLCCSAAFVSYLFLSNCPQLTNDEVLKLQANLQREAEPLASSPTLVLRYNWESLLESCFWYEKYRQQGKRRDAPPVRAWTTSSSEGMLGQACMVKGKGLAALILVFLYFFTPEMPIFPMGDTDIFYLHWQYLHPTSDCVCLEAS